MPEQDIHGVRDMSPETLEVIALGYGEDGGRTGAAKAQIERNRRKFEERLVSVQTDAAERIAGTQIKIARISVVTAGLAAVAAVAVSVVAILEYLSAP